MEYTDVRTKIKTYLEEQNLTYAKLAGSLQMSESGVKKLFQAKDISLERLNQICQILGVPLHELLDPGLHPDQTETIVLNERAQDYFMKNKGCFLFLLLLHTEPKSVTEIAKAYGIPKTRLYGYLRDLESLKLLKWLPGDKVNLKKDIPTLFKYEGKFMKAIVREWAEELLEEALSATSYEDYEMSTEQVFHLTKKSAIEFRTALADIIFEFSKRSIREKKRHPNQVKPLRVMSILREGHFVKKV